jgi:phosphoenolpyruvate carboxykinase (GTP)
VFRASSLGSETTAASAGEAGVVRRDPMAMFPFCGYNMADYFGHWLKGLKVQNPPKIFIVNWFKKDASGNFIWPGFRDNSRVVKWMLDRIHGKVSAQETTVGLLPYIKDLMLDGLNIGSDTLAQLFELNPAEWKKEIEGIETFYAQFGERLPTELTRHLERLKQSFA